MSDPLPRAFNNVAFGPKARKRKGFSEPVRLRDCIVCDLPIFKGDPTEFGPHGRNIGLRHAGCVPDVR